MRVGRLLFVSRLYLGRSEAVKQSLCSLVLQIVTVCIDAMRAIVAEELTRPPQQHCLS